MFKGAIFDVDGTILDTMTVWQEVTTKFLTERNLPVIAEEMAAYKEMIIDESMTFIREKYGLSESVQELKDEFNRLVSNAYFFEVNPKPGIKEYMEKLKSEGVKIAIATSGYKDLAEAALKRLGMADMIDAYALSCEVGVKKSNPDVYLLAAKRIDVAPKDCMVFEDILIGIQGAKKGGMKTTAIYDDLNAEDTEKLKKEADRYIKDWTELL